MRAPHLLRFLITGMCLLGAAPDFAQDRAADACQLALAAALPLTIPPGGHRLLIQATANSAKLTMIVDTGAEGLAITQKAAEHIARRSDTRGLDDDRLTYAGGVGGTRVATKMTLDNLVLGRLHGTYDNVLITDRDFSLDGVEMDGLLGMTVLANFDIDLDIPGQELRLFRAQGDCRRPTVNMAPPFFPIRLESGYHDAVRLMVPVQINGKPFHALLDTGAPRTLLFAHAAEALGLAPTVAASLHKVVGIGGATQAFAARLDTFTVGEPSQGITIRNMPVGVASEDNQEADLLLGLDFVSKMHVWVSNSAHMLVLEYPPQPSPQVAGEK